MATLFGERLVFVASGGTVYYYFSPANVKSISFENCSSIKQIVAQARYGEFGSFDVYVIGKDDTGCGQ